LHFFAKAKEKNTRVGSEDAVSAGKIGAGVLVSLSIFWILSTFAHVEETFSTSDLVAFSGMAAVVTLLQLWVISAIARAGRSIATIWSVAAGLMVLNAWSFHLTLVEAFIFASLALKLTFLAAGFFIAFTIVRMACESVVLRRLIFVAISVLIVGSVMTSKWTLLPTYSDTGAASDIERRDGMTASPKIHKVDFETTPNVYLIGFESAAPAAVLARNLGLNNSALSKSFEDNDFHVFRNVFVENVPTRRSFNALLAMERGYYLSIVDRGHDHLFQGIRPSPLIENFTHNGYETTAVNAQTFFGAGKGDFIDNYEINSEFSVCHTSPKRTWPAKFFGACYLREIRWLFPSRPKVQGKSIDFLMANLETVTQRKQPQLFIGHINPPNHTSSDFDSSDEAQVRRFRKRYEGASKTASVNLTRIKEFIRSHDDEFILLVFGDHGIYMSRRHSFEDDPTFFVQDRYGVVAGAYPSDICSQYWASPFSEGYITTAEIARLVIQCLAGGVDPFIVPYSHSAYDDAREIDLKAYRYE
jgi:hypothetical protein